MYASDIVYNIWTMDDAVIYVYNIVCHVVYDIICRYRIQYCTSRRMISYVNILYHIQYRTKTSIFYDLVRPDRSKHTLIPYDVACIGMQYKGLQCEKRYCLPGAAFSAGRTGHVTGVPIGLASWFSALPDGLYCIVTVLTPFPSVLHTST